MTSPNASTLLVVSSDRPAIQTFFTSLGSERTTLATICCPSSVEQLTARLSQPADARIIILDVAPEPARAAELCRELRCRHPELPILALFCCSYAATPAHLRALLDAGVSGVLDLSTPAAKMEAVLEDATRGRYTLRLELEAAQSSGLGAFLCAEAPGATAALADEDRQLLALLTQGLTDEESGRRLHLSAHTVQHHVQRLWEGLGLRNRTELAAWAGCHGLYQPMAPPVHSAGERRPRK